MDKYSPIEMWSIISIVSYAVVIALKEVVCKVEQGMSLDILLYTFILSGGLLAIWLVVLKPLTKFHKKIGWA